jgi:hypothetical protein
MSAGVSARQRRTANKQAEIPTDIGSDDWSD